MSDFVFHEQVSSTACDEFLGIMHDFTSNRASISNASTRISSVFTGHPALNQAFFQLLALQSSRNHGPSHNYKSLTIDTQMIDRTSSSSSSSSLEPAGEPSPAHSIRSSCSPPSSSSHPVGEVTLEEKRQEEGDDIWGCDVPQERHPFKSFRSVSSLEVLSPVIQRDRCSLVMEHPSLSPKPTTTNVNPTLEKTLVHMELLSASTTIDTGKRTISSLSEEAEAQDLEEEEETEASFDEEAPTTISSSSPEETGESREREKALSKRAKFDAMPLPEVVKMTSELTELRKRIEVQAHRAAQLKHRHRKGGPCPRCQLDHQLRAVKRAYHRQALEQNNGSLVARASLLSSSYTPSGTTTAVPTIPAWKEGKEDKSGIIHISI